jgi:predicted DNA-binding protein (UPF0251 family)
MARPFKYRRVCFNPEVNYFKPAGIPLINLEEVRLSLDEFEALRLADFEGFYQEDAAKEMNVSRQTFGNIISAAHKKIADSIIHGKAIKIEGGVYQLEEKRTFICYECQHEWQITYGKARPINCPKCQNKNIHRSPKERGYMRSSGGLGHVKGRRRS